MGLVRAAKSKVRTGCRTCKARRVKCDEAKPDCNRCSSTGRECGGYEIIAPRAVSHGHAPRVILPGRPPAQTPKGASLSNPPSSIPGATVDEMNYFSYFCRYTAPTISGAFPSQFFERFVLQLSMREPMIRHAATALGALQRAQERNGRVTLGQEEAGFALRQYGKAINLAREKLLAPDLSSQRLELVACVLFVCFEIAQKRCHETAMHLENGMNLLVNVRHRGHLPSGWDTENFDTNDDASTLDREITRTFDRLDIQSTFVRSTRPKISTDPIAIARKTPRKFTSLEQAREYLNALTRSVATFRHDVRATPTPFSFEDESRLKLQQMQIRTQMQAWNAAFGSLRLCQVPLPPESPVPQDVSAKAVLEGMAIYAGILLETGVADGKEAIFDNFTSDFKLIVDLGQIAKDHPRHPVSAGHGNGGSSFHIHMACVPTVYIVALKCRDPTIRRRALELLETFPFREGMWDAPIGAQLCKHVMQLEESGYEGLRCAQDLPERARIHEAMFDVNDLEGGIKCYYKRRDFDGEYGRPGSWLSWSGRAQVVNPGYEEPYSVWDCAEMCHNISAEIGKCMGCGRLAGEIQSQGYQIGWVPSPWDQPLVDRAWEDGYSSSGAGSPFESAAPTSPPRLEPPGRGPAGMLLRSRTHSTNTLGSLGTGGGDSLRDALEAVDFSAFDDGLSNSPEQPDLILER